MTDRLPPVAILGRSPDTAHLVRESQAAEVWGIGVVYKDGHHLQDGCPPMTRLYEIHPEWIISDPKYNDKHYTHLLNGPHEYEIITAPAVNELTEQYYIEWFGSAEKLRAWVEADRPAIPNSRPYPLGAALALQHNIRRGEQPNRFLTNTVDYAIAHAILENRERIELYGVDLDTKTEYAYQRPGVSFWLGIAAGKGIDVRLCEETPILRAKIYGVELGGQMVTRQKLELLRAQFSDLLMAEQRGLNHLQGRLQARVYDLEKDPESAELRDKVAQLNTDYTAALRKAERVVGAHQILNKLIDTCDLQEPSWALDETTTFSLG